MTGPGVTVLFAGPAVVALSMVCSEELFRGWRWLRRIYVGRIDEAFMPPFVAVVFPSGRQWRLWQIRVKDNSE